LPDIEIRVMEKFIALLRGINVSGQKKIKMPDLKVLFEDLLFTNVQTYIQSGNVLFTGNSSNIKTIRSKIEKKILSKFGFPVNVILKTPAELDYALKINPFLKDKTKDIERIYFTFLSENPSPDNIKKLKEIDYSPEEFSLNDNTIYLFVPNGYGKAKLNNNFFEKKLKLYATTRNYKTVNALLNLSRDL
jgi:uncharacterized protein (DUF1697 family)